MHIRFRRLTRWHWQRLLHDRQKMINEQSKCSAGQVTTQKNPHFELEAFEKLAEIKRSERRVLRDAPLLCAEVLPLPLTVNRWLLLIDGRPPTLPLNTNVRYQAFGPLLLTAVSTMLYQHPSVTLLVLSSLIS